MGNHFSKESFKLELMEATLIEAMRKGKLSDDTIIILAKEGFTSQAIIDECDLRTIEEGLEKLQLPLAQLAAAKTFFKKRQRKSAITKKPYLFTKFAADGRRAPRERNSNLDSEERLVRRLTENTPMSDEHKEHIRKCYVTLIASTSPDVTINQLYGMHVITDKEKETCQAMLTSQDKVQKLLDCIVKKSDRAYRKLVEALTFTGQGHLAKAITGTDQTR